MSLPLPIPDAETAPFWDAARDGRLAYQRCADCGVAIFYPRLVCPHCLSDRLDWEDSAGAGTLYSVTVVYRAPAAFRDLVPYAVALVDLDEGFRMMARIDANDPNALKIGDRVAVRFLPQVDGVALPVFAPDGA